MSEVAPTPPGPSRRSVASRARAYLAGAALIALVVAFGVFAIGWSQYSIWQRSDDLSRQVAALARGQAAGSRLTSATTATQARLFQVEAGLIGAALFVTDDAGVVQRSSMAKPPASLPLARLGQPSTGGTRAGVLRNGAGVQVLVVAAAVDSGHQLVAVQGLSEIRRAQTGLLLLAGVALVVAAVVAYVAGGILARRLTRPLVRLETAAEQVTAGAFGTQVAEEGDAETASLARSFNRMSLRVADAYAAQKAFVGDVSHEMPTPFASSGTRRGASRKRRARCSPCPNSTPVRWSWRAFRLTLPRLPTRCGGGSRRRRRMQASRSRSA